MSQINVDVVANATPNGAAPAGERETSQPPPPMTLKEELLALQGRRVQTEANVQEALSFLETTPVGMYEPLVDEEGFPRADCDLYAVRTARNTVICGRNDLRAIEEELYEKLGELHESTKDEAQEQMVADEAARRAGKAAAEARQRRLADTLRISKLLPLFTVAGVEAGSPAEEAGLCPGNLILQYSDINSDNIKEKGLGSIPAATKSHEGKVLSLWVREAGSSTADPRELQIVPRQWADGRGLLGCALDPI